MQIIPFYRLRLLAFPRIIHAPRSNKERSLLMPEKPNELSFEDAMDRLEGIVSDMEGGPHGARRYGA